MPPLEPRMAWGWSRRFNWRKRWAGCPAIVKIFTIEAHDISPGAPLDQDISRRLDVLVERVLGGLAVLDDQNQVTY